MGFFKSSKLKDNEMAALAVPVAEIITRSWLKFLQSGDKDPTGNLVSNLRKFYLPVIDSLKKLMPELETAPNSFFNVTIMLGINRSETNTSEEVLSAFEILFDKKP